MLHRFSQVCDATQKVKDESPLAHLKALLPALQPSALSQQCSSPKACLWTPLEFLAVGGKRAT